MKNLKQKKIGVLMGGLSGEREVSLRSGRAVATALKSRGYNVVEVDVGRDVAATLRAERVERAVVMLHGGWGEDGTIQGMLELMGIPYSGSGTRASAVSKDKNLTKILAQHAGIRTPAWKVIPNEEAESIHESPLPLPVVVKPNQEGSTLGVTIVKKTEEFKPALNLAASFPDELILVEKYIVGREITVGVLSGKVLPPLEIIPKSGFYDFASKYTKGMTEYIVPAKISDAETKLISDETEKIFRFLGLQGIARADFILADQPYFLEINAIPGMTETSLIPKAAQSAGISFEDLCENLVKTASLKVGREG